MTNDDAFLADLARIANRAHTNTPGADSPPDSMWQHVLAQVQPIDSQQEQFMTTLAMPTPAAGPAESSPNRGISHYANLAASILIIGALALGGWYAAMQLNNPGAPEPRFAAVTGAPVADSQTCDVEPMSVDRAMEIVQNPAPFMRNGPMAEPDPGSATLFPGGENLNLVRETSIPAEADFQTVHGLADAYLACVITGTQAQVWTFYSPIALQQKILSDMGVFRSEAEVRDHIETQATLPGYMAEAPWRFQVEVTTRGIAHVTVNPDFQLAIQQRSESDYFDQVIRVGVNMSDGEGKLIALTNGSGRQIAPPPDPASTGVNEIDFVVTLARTRGGDTWLVIPYPSYNELGWPEPTSVATP